MNASQALDPQNWEKTEWHPISGDDLSLPERFTFPFHYQPHPLTLWAASELQHYLKTQQSWQHDFGFEGYRDAHTSGKMFGVLVVEDLDGRIGYLAAFSGKMAGSVQWPGFVPPVFDMLDPSGFYRRGEDELIALNAQIEALERHPQLLELKARLAQTQTEAAQILAEAKERHREAKLERGRLRERLNSSSDAQLREAESVRLAQESRLHQFEYKDLTREWKTKIQLLEQELQAMQAQLRSLKESRRQRSNALQDMLFENYTFLNANQQRQSLRRIFAEVVPPSGAGDCAAPRLLQRAFSLGLKPRAMAEFWWGISPETEVREHGNFYPACRGKCKPILGHMLKGLEVDPNPLEVLPGDAPQIRILHEDPDFLVIEKPANLLSVPGRGQSDTVLDQIKRRYPEITGPVIVHRLDLSTSGIMLIPRNLESYIALQKQFIQRSIEKRYTAVLEGVLQAEQGIIELPLRVDLEDRPRQVVCYTYGKPAITRWEKVHVSEQRTRVYFYPETGRTHQLRVHAAHALGLNAPIVGDDLYGRRDRRLHLHAGKIAFSHPKTGQRLTFTTDPDF
jgi:tRNA pseudouridine32 synthase/23S rRNA pseudouridine746 synthase